jgi:hypothetical protein
MRKQIRSTVVVSVRLPTALHAELLAEAERSSAPLGDVVRCSIAKGRDQLPLDQQLSRLEARLFRRLFASSCAIAGLDESERAIALAEAAAILQGGLK